MPRQHPGTPFLYDDVTGDLIGVRDPDGGESFPFAPRMTFAQMKALTGMVEGQMVCVTNYGKGGSTWRYSATLADWFPTAPLKVYENTALISGVAQTADQLLLAIPCEAGLLASKVFRLLISFGKTGTTDASGSFAFRLGTAGTTADTSFATAGAGALAAGVRSVGFESWHRMASATSVNKLGGLAAGSFQQASGSGVVLNNATTVANVASQAVYLSLTTAMGGATDTPQLGYVALEIQP